MAEVGAIASIIGIIGAGTKLSVVLFDFAQSIGSSGSEIRATGKEISLFCSVLRQLERTLAESKDRHSSGALETTNNVLEQCKSIFNEIDTIVSGLQKQRRSPNEASIDLSARIKWIFGKKSKVQMHRASLESCSIMLHLMLTTLGFARSVSACGSSAAHTELDGTQEETIAHNLVIAQQCAVETLEELEEEQFGDFNSSDDEQIATPKAENSAKVRGAASIRSGYTSSIRSTGSNMSSVLFRHMLEEFDNTTQSARTSILSNSIKHPQLSLLLRKWTDQGDYANSTQEAVHPSDFNDRRTRRRKHHSENKASKDEQPGVQEMNQCKRELGKENPQTLASMTNLAAAYKQQKRWKKAAKLEYDLMTTQIRVFGPEHPNTLHTMSDLAITYMELFQWTEAKNLGVQVLETRKRILGAEHSDSIGSMINLAAVYSSQASDRVYAEKLLNEVLEIRTKVLGRDHPDTVDILVRLVMLHGKYPRRGKVSELEDEARERCTRVLQTTKDPGTLSFMVKLAKMVADLEPERQRELETLIMERRKIILGAEHPDTLNSMLGVAILYRKAQPINRSTEAQQLEVQIMDKSIRLLKRVDNPEILSRMAELAEKFALEAKCVGAEQLMVQIVEARKNILGADHPATLESIVSLADTKLLLEKRRLPPVPRRDRQKRPMPLESLFVLNGTRNMYNY